MNYTVTDVRVDTRFSRASHARTVCPQFHSLAHSLTKPLTSTHSLNQSLTQSSGLERTHNRLKSGELGVAGWWWHACAGVESQASESRV